MKALPKKDWLFIIGSMIFIVIMFAYGFTRPTPWN